MGISPLPANGRFTGPRARVWASLESVEAIEQKCSFAETGADVRFLSPKICRATNVCFRGESGLFSRTLRTSAFSQEATCGHH